MNWKELALQLYFQLFGRRCVVCSLPVAVEEVHIETRDKECYLMHLGCKEKL